MPFQIAQVLPEFKLCLILGNVAYFTTQDVVEQWGDDFDDAPYDCNAGTPYLPTVYNYADGVQRLSVNDWHPDGTPRWQVLHVLFTSNDDLQCPCATYGRTAPSVKEINTAKIPWLTARKWDTNQKTYISTGSLLPGASYDEFVSFVENNGGTVWIPRNGLQMAISPAPMPGVSFAT